MIRVAIIGVGNCAKSLVEGVALYGELSPKNRKEMGGLAFDTIGGFGPEDIEFCLAYDVDHRKVGERLEVAIYSAPNCAKDLYYDPDRVCLNCPPVKMGVVSDGVADHMVATPGEEFEKIILSNERPHLKSEIVEHLKQQEIDVALIYLPVGSHQATRFYVECLLEAKVPFVNCIPEFIVSDPEWGFKLKEAGIPAIGDDMRSQVGASVLSQVLQEMFLDRGAKVRFHCQTNQGGNTDFLNMKNPDRISSKKISKENVIVSQNKLRGVEHEKNSIHAGPSDFIPYLRDNKVAHIRIEAEGFGGAPIELDCRLSVQDSPNSAGVVIDAIRYLHVAHLRGASGPLYGPSAATQKTPPMQMRFKDAFKQCELLAMTDVKHLQKKSEEA